MNSADLWIPRERTYPPFWGILIIPPAVFSIGGLVAWLALSAPAQAEMWAGCGALATLLFGALAIASIAFGQASQIQVGHGGVMVRRTACVGRWFDIVDLTLLSRPFGFGFIAARGRGVFLSPDQFQEARAAFPERVRPSRGGTRPHR